MQLYLTSTIVTCGCHTSRTIVAIVRLAQVTQLQVAAAIGDVLAIRRHGHDVAKIAPDDIWFLVGTVWKRNKTN